MTTTANVKIPRTLKRKLEASLEALTPYESGRLYGIYSLEAAKKNLRDEDYGPIKDLHRAWERRIDKAKDNIEGRKVVRQYNGFVFLIHVDAETNHFVLVTLLELLANIYPQVANLRVLLFGDTLSQMATQVIGMLYEDVPWPVTPAQYDQIVAAEDQTPEGLEFHVEAMVEVWAKANFEELEVPYDFMQEHKAEEERRVYYSDERIRRLWVEFEGEDQVLKNRFGGDRDKLEVWLRDGNYVGLSKADYDAKYEEIYDQLEAWAESGEMKAVKTVRYSGAWADVPVTQDDDGRFSLPVWAALLHIWDSWLYDNQCRREEYPVPAPGSVGGIRQVYRMEDGTEVEGEALAALVAGLVEECRAKPWGKGIPKQVDYAAVAAFLLEDPNSLTNFTAPNLGQADLESFREDVEDLNDRLEPDWGVTKASLRPKVEVMGFDPSEVGLGPDASFVLKRFFPSLYPEEHAKGLANAFEQLRKTRFTTRNIEAAFRPTGTVNLADYIGIMARPLELIVQNIRERVREFEELNLAIDRLSNDYFGGLPVISPQIQPRFDELGETIQEATNLIDKWLEHEGFAQGVDWSVLDLSPLEPREERVKEFVDFIMQFALRSGGFKSFEDFDLGDDIPLKGKGK